MRYMTVIIPFYNEGVEVRNTLDNIRRTVGGRVDILLVNDASEDTDLYREWAEKYQAEYIGNTERSGVAASRDLGIEKCETPYFLLLDAHMRFYQKNWDELLVEELKKDERVLLCCNTKMLVMGPEGLLVEKKEVRKVYGATVSFRRDRNILDAEWFYTEHQPGQPVEDIACVLGAAYAGSKKYWQYLHGLSGLQRYGCDETYISMKIGLEGGRCRLLKNLYVGHLYRKRKAYCADFPYMIYNKLLIADLLLPRIWQIHVFGLLQRNNRQAFREAYGVWLANRPDLERERQYYQKIFTRKFSDILEQNRIGQKREVSPKRRKLLDDIACRVLVNCNALNQAGIFHGKMGGILFLAKYYCFTRKEEYLPFIEELIRELSENIYSGLPVNFAEGLCGIAYGFLFLWEQGIVEGDVDEILSDLDQLIMERDPLRMTDYSLATGLSGIFYYVLYRIRINVRRHALFPFEESYLEKLDLRAASIPDDPSCSECLEMAWLYSAFRSGSVQDYSLLELGDLMYLEVLKEQENDISTFGLKYGWAGVGWCILAESIPDV